MGITKKVLAVFLVSMFFISSAYAAPIGNSSDSKIPYGDGMLQLKDSIGTVKISFDAEHVNEKELSGGSDITDAKLEGQWYLLRFAYPMFEEKFEPYFKLGVSHIESSWYQSGGYTGIKGDYELAWGAGAKLIAYEIPEHRIRFVLDGQYRSTSPDVDNATVNDSGRSISAAEFEVNEWQIGGIVSMEFPLGGGKRKKYKGPSDIYSIVPYIGVAYSQSDIKSSFTYSGSNYNIGDAENDNSFLLITGCDLVLPQNASINIEGRFIGETSVSGGATLKF